jgi:predicted nucleotidyltransferase
MDHEYKEHDLEVLLPDCRPAVLAVVQDYVRKAVMLYGDEVLSITLYGSQARGDASIESDIDLFIVVQKDTPALRQALVDLAWQIQFEHDVVISDIIYSVEQFQQMQSRQFPYYQSIQRDGILLWKNESALTPSYG